MTPQLIQVSEDTQLWAEPYTAVLADIFEVQSDIAKQVSEQLGIALLEPQRRSLEARPTENLEAYDFYLRGNDYLNRGRELHSAEQVDFAIPMYEEAVRLDPTFALAYARLSAAHGWYLYYLNRTEVRRASAQEAVDRALELDPELPGAHYALGLILLSSGEWDQALKEFQIVLKSQPGNAEVFEEIGKVETALGQWEDARTTLEKAMNLHPQHGRLPCWTGGRSFGLRDFREAIRLHDRAIEVTPDRTCPYYCKALIYLNWDGSTERAHSFLERVPPNVGLEKTPPINYPWVLVNMMDGRYQDALDRLSAGSAKVYEFTQSIHIPKDLLAAQIYGLMDRPELEKAHYEAARDLLEAEVKERHEEHRIHSSLGIAYAGLGHNEDAIREGRLGLELLGGNQGVYLGFRLKDLAQIYLMVGDLDGAIDQLEHLLSVPAWFSAPYLKIDPTWNPLRDHPRFLALLEKYGSRTASRSGAR